MTVERCFDGGSSLTETSGLTFNLFFTFGGEQTGGRMKEKATEILVAGTKIAAHHAQRTNPHHLLFQTSSETRTINHIQLRLRLRPYHIAHCSQLAATTMQLNPITGPRIKK